MRIIGKGKKPFQMNTPAKLVFRMVAGRVVGRVFAEHKDEVTKRLYAYLMRLTDSDRFFAEEFRRREKALRRMSLPDDQILRVLRESVEGTLTHGGKSRKRKYP